MDRVSCVSTANVITTSGWTEGTPLSTDLIPEDSSHDLSHRGSRVCNPRTEEMEAGGRNVEASQFVIPG